MLIISLSEKGGETKQLQFDKTEAVIGRVQGNEIVLAKGNVSKRHCRISTQDGKFLVEDMKSTNGTYVNGRKISEVLQIYQGDKIYIGDFIIRVENAPSPEAASLGDEAGSLSTALGNRRAPGAAPSAPARPTGQVPVAGDGARAVPPPPPPRRDTIVPSAAPPSLPEPPPPPPAPPPATDLDLDDEPLATRPPRSVPPPAPPPPKPAARTFVPDADDQAAAAAAPASSPPTPAAKPAAPRASTAAPNQISNPSDPAGWVKQLLADASVAGIFVLGAESIEIERGGKRETVGLGDAESTAMVKTLRALATAGGAAATAATVEVKIPGDALLTAIFPPTASQICASIRRAPSGSQTLHDLSESGAMSNEMREVIEACVVNRRNLILGGDPAATQMILAALAHSIPSSMRVVAAGARVRASDPGQAWADVALDGDGGAILRTAVAVRPDVLIVDVSSAEVAAEVVRACALGAQGAVVCVLGRSAQDAVERLGVLARSAMRGDGVDRLVGAGFEAVAFAATLPDGKPRLIEIAETTVDGGGVRATCLLQYRDGKFQKGGKSARLGPALSLLGRSVAALA